jgi:hypothetical protein
VSAVILLAGCGSEPGNPDVYARINAMTDCAELQREFDQADANRSLPTDDDIPIAYMKAADERMDEIGCYG